MNPALWLTRTAARHGDRPALFDGPELVATYAQFTQRAASVAMGLVNLGAKPGDRVAIFLPNRVEYLTLLYGIWFCGAIPVPINAKLHRREAEWIIKNAQAALAVTDSSQPDDLKVPCQVLDAEDPRLREPWCDLDTTRAPVPMTSDDIGWLFYTSGTTGKPKGVKITCGNILAMTLSYIADVDEVRPEDAILYAAPMSHGAGLYNFMHVLRGARHIVPVSRGFDPEEILDLGRSMGPVSMFAAPTMVRRLVDVARTSGANGEGLRTIVYGGGPMFEADIREAVDQFGPRFVQIYGQGECPMGITALPRSDVAERSAMGWRERLNSVGRTQSAVELRIVGADDTELPLGEVGEITVRGATVMAGYWRNEPATDNALRDGWLYTGDLGRLDAQGFLTLHDRSKDMIISGGSNIYPREVEEVLLSHPAVREAAVVGRADADFGEAVVAFISLHPGKTVAPDTLDALCLAHIARFKRPKAYEFLPDLPKNNYGKILKTDLRALLERNAAHDG